MEVSEGKLQENGLEMCKMYISDMFLILLKRDSVEKKNAAKTHWEDSTSWIYIYIFAMLRSSTNSHIDVRSVGQVGLDCNSDRAGQCMYVLEPDVCKQHSGGHVTAKKRIRRIHMWVVAAHTEFPRPLLSFSGAESTSHAHISYYAWCWSVLLFILIPYYLL